LVLLAMPVLASDPLARNYVAPLASPAGILFVLLLLGSVVATFFVSYGSGGAQEAPSGTSLGLKPSGSAL
jgi:hypothetical protein